jgi:hypothetical protein
MAGVPLEGSNERATRDIEQRENSISNTVSL